MTKRGATANEKAATRHLLLFLRNGPNNQPEKHGFRAEYLSLLGPSELWTFGRRAVEYSKGDCRVVCLGYRTGKYISKARFMMRIAGVSLYRRWVKGVRITVCSPDPFWNGLLSVFLKWTCGARFICEINGNFTNRGNLAEILDPVEREKKFRRMNGIGAWVARRADHLKLLYPGQVDGWEGTEAVHQTAILELYDEAKYEYHELGEEPILVFVGFPFLLKGLDILLEAFANVRAEFPDWKLVLIGFRLEEWARALELPTEGVDFLGPLPSEDVASWMARSQGLVLPSRAEGMGRVLLEAARVGRARLGSRVGGIQHYINDEVDGLLFEPEDPEDLARVLRRFFGDRALRAQLGAEARRTAEREFTTEVWIREWKRLLDFVATSG